MKTLRTILLLLLLFIFGPAAFAQSIRIVCHATIDTTNRPLYVLFFSKRKVRTLANKKAADSVFKSFNTNYIENLEVIKDPSAAALYGSRAQHGALIIYIKKQYAQKAYKELEQYLD